MRFCLLEDIRESLSEEVTFYQRPIWSHSGFQALTLGYLPGKRPGQIFTRKLADTAKLGADDLLEAW